MKKVAELLLANKSTFHVLIIASLALNLLALASSIFVMQVLGRYVSYGVDATLATLCAGTLIAILFEYLFRHFRLQIARAISAPFDRSVSDKTFRQLIGLKFLALENIRPGVRQEIARAPEVIATAYSPGNLMAVLDVPFALLFLLVIVLFNPVLAVVAAVFCGATFWMGTQGPKRFTQLMSEATEILARKAAVLSSATGAGEVIRAFCGGDFLLRQWHDRSFAARTLQRRIDESKGLLQHSTQALGAVMGVAIITIGGMMVVHGQYDISSLVGINILAGRALGTVSRFAQLSESVARSKRGQELLGDLSRLAVEGTGVGILPEYKGKLDLKDIAFCYPKAPAPVFEGLTLELSQGDVLLVQGPNGSGKTTFTRLLMGLLDPSRGQILADGVDIRQLRIDQWRRQIMFLPQEVSLLNLSIADNLQLGRDDITAEYQAKTLSAVRLNSYVNQLPDGAQTEITNHGGNLSLGIRRRLGLARALLQSRDGRIVLLDEPNAGLDRDGRAAVADILNFLRQTGRTIIVVGEPADLPYPADYVLDLAQKPSPSVARGTVRKMGDAGAEA